MGFIAFEAFQKKFEQECFREHSNAIHPPMGRLQNPKTHVSCEATLIIRAFGVIKPNLNDS